MKKYLYPIVIKKIRPYLKYWFLKGGKYVSAILQSLPLTLNNTLMGIIKNIKIYGNTEQDGTPTPETPVEIKNVEGKNIFDKNSVTYKDRYYLNDNGEEVSNSTTGYTTSFYNVRPKTVYTISGTFSNTTGYLRIYYYDKNKNFISRTTSSSITTGSYTFTTPNDCYYIQFQYKVGYVDFDTIQIEKSPVATEYLPYNSLGVKIQNKNLFNMNALGDPYPASLSYLVEGNKVTIEANVTTGAQLVRSYVKNVNPSKTYTVSFKAKKVVKGTANSSIIGRIYGSNDDVNYTAPLKDIAVTASNVVQGQTYSLSDTVTGYKFYRLFFYNNTGATVPDGDKTEYWDIQFEEGSNATDFVVHQEQVKYFTFEAGQYLAEGGYLADNGIHNVWRKRTITNVEGVGTASTGINYAKMLGTVSGAKTNGYVYCSKYSNSSDASKNNSIRLVGTTLYVYNNTFTSKAIAEEALIGLEFQYELAEETITSYTPTQQAQWNAIKKMKTYNEQTNIDVLANLPCKISLDYLMKGGDN